MTIVQEDNRRDEINFARLLSRTEEMAKERRGSFDWRLEQYVMTLTESLKQLKKMSSNQPKHVNLMDYTRRVGLLSGLLQSDRMTSTSLKALALKQLTASKDCNDNTEDYQQVKSNCSPGSDGGEAVVRGSGRGGRGVVRRFGRTSLGQQLLVETRTRLDGELREELLGGTHKRSNNKKRRDGEEGERTKGEIVQEQERVQERLADDMLMLARSLKENANLAGRIVREDNERLAQSAVKTDENLVNLRKEADRLQMHLRNFCSCWLWLMLLSVMITFVAMVVFMKSFPKHS